MNPDKKKKQQKGALATGRLVTGIISIVLFALISFQSCAAGLSNALEQNNATSGTAGLLLAFVYLIAGIIGVATRGSAGAAGPAVCSVFYFIDAALTIGTGSSFGDLPVCGFIACAFGIVYAAAAVKTKKMTNKERY